MTEPTTEFPGWQLADVPCDFCGTTAADVRLEVPDRLLGTATRFHVVACRQCGLARTNPRPTPASLDAAYHALHEPPGNLPQHLRPPAGVLCWALTNYRGYPPAPGAAPLNPVLRALLAPLGAWTLARRKNLVYLPYAGAGRLLDFGCGPGGYVARAAAAGWQAEGLDLSPDAVAVGRAAGLVIHHGTLPGAELPPESYDAVTAWHALEHVPSPLATLRAVHRLLAPGGRLLVAVPRLDSLPARWFGPAWYPLGVPLHLTHFTRATLLRHLDAAGFDAVAVRSLRHASFIRQSFGYRAAASGGAFARGLGRSRFVAGTLSWLAWAARREAMILVLARRR